LAAKLANTSSMACKAEPRDAATTQRRVTCREGQSDLTVREITRPALSYSGSTCCPARVIDSGTRCSECHVVVVVRASPVPLASTLVVTSPRSFVV
jgi:hypothetical protein